MVISLRTARKTEGDEKYQLKCVTLSNLYAQNLRGGGDKYYQISETFQNLMGDLPINIQVFGRITRTIPDNNNTTMSSIELPIITI